MKIQRKWRRAWQRGKPHWAVYRPLKKKRQAVKNNVIRMASKVAKKLLPPVAAASLLLSSVTGAYASPQGGQVVSGAGSIAQNGNTTNITQTTDKMSVNWQSFNIAANEKVNFYQPGASSVALNRVLGNNASSIYGQLNANGKVFLINPNGVLFAKGAQVNVGGLVASTLSLSDKDFQNGKYSFTGKDGSVVNQGNITAADGGYVALLGGQVSNQGVIVANKGTVALGAGNAVTLDMDGDGLLSLAVNQSAVNALSENKNLIEADGGVVIMTARAADKLAATAVNNSGVIQARSINTKNGVILLDGGENGTVKVSGTLDASGKTAGETGGTIKVLGNNINVASAKLDASGDQGGGTVLVGGNYQGSGTEQHAATTTVAADATLKADAVTSGNGGKVVVWSDKATKFDGSISAKGGSQSGDGGSVETSGKHLIVGSTARVTTTAAKGMNGNWLLDPTNFTITSGSGAQTDSGIGADTLAANLGGGNIGISTATTGSEDGDINVNAAVSWSANTKLTLSAANNINVNANISASGDTAGLVLAYGSGGSYSLSSGAEITLSGNSPTLSIGGKDYTVLNATNYLSYLSALNMAGQYALGCDVDATAVATATGQAMSPIGTSTSAFTGIFDGLGHTVSKLTLSGGASKNVGLFGYTGSTAVIRNLGLTNVNISGGCSNVGALVGYNNGSIENCNSAGMVSGTNNIGGLVGDNYGTIINSASSVTVSATGNSLGGLVGANEKDAVVFGSSSSGIVTRTAGGKKPYTGGLVGYNEGKIIDCSSSAIVTSSKSYTGGLVGYNADGQITGSWSTGNVTGVWAVGGLVGQNKSTIIGSFSSGSVTATDTAAGGLIGYNTGHISDSYHTAGLVTSSKGTIGGLIGWNSALIEDCYNNSDVTMTGPSTQSCVGGLIGDNKGTVTGTDKNKSYSSGSVTSNGANVGGLIGYNEPGGAITGYSSTSNVSGTTEVGGLVGLLGDSAGTATSCTATITDCSAAGTVTGSGNHVGGLVGYSKNNISGKISGSHSTGNVTGAGYVGGLIGGNEKSSINDCYYENGLVTSTAGCVGGLLGWNSATISTCYSTGDVKMIGASSQSYVGGLIGYNSGAVQGINYSTGAVTSTGGYVGGLFGWNNSAVTSCYSAGSVTGGAGYVGGLIGANAGCVSGCHSTVDVSGGGDCVGGLLGFNSSATVSDCYHETGAVTSTGNMVGGLIGNNTGSVSGSHSTGSVTGGGDVGGLVGTNAAHITNCFSTCTVVSNGADYSWSPDHTNPYANAGGLVGYNKMGNITDCYSTGSVTGTLSIFDNTYHIWYGGRMVGGLVGYVQSGAILRSYHANGAVTGTDSDVGGLVGATGTGGVVEYCYNTGDVKGWLSVGGLVGESSGAIRYSYNTGAVLGTKSGGGYFGGLVGLMHDNGTVTQCYSIGSLEGAAFFVPNYTGGVVGYSTAANAVNAVTSCYWSTDNNPSISAGMVFGDNSNNIAGTDSSGATTLAQMKQSGNYSGWDIATTGGSSSIWRSYDGYSYPLLRSFLTPVTVATDSVTKTYDGTVGAPMNVTYSVAAAASDPLLLGKDTLSYGTNKNVGAYNLSGNLYSTDNQGYDVSYNPTSTLTITQRQLTAVATVQDKVYDGNTNATVNGVSFGNLVDGEALTAVFTGGSFADKNAGTGIGVTVNDVTMTAGNANTLVSNYALPTTVTTTADISKRQLTGNATAANKVYDGNANATVTGVTFGNVVDGEFLTAGYDAVGSFADKNAGSGKTVTVSGVTMTSGNANTLTSNYLLPAAVTTTATISQRQLTSTATAETKVYDGNTNTTVTGVTFGNLVDGEELTAGYTGGAFADKNAGENKAVTFTGLSMTANNANTLTSNYLLPTTVSTSATISKRQLTASATAQNKVYDGTTDATVTGVSFGNLVDGEALTAGFTGGSFADKNAGTGIGVTINGVTMLAGNGNTLTSNYALPTTVTTTANISQRQLSAIATAASKVYDGNMDATVTNVTFGNLVDGESLTAGYTGGSFADKNAGPGKTVTVSGVTMTAGNANTLAGNYLLPTIVSTTADITPRQLTAAATAQNKVYDGTTNTTVTGVTFGNLVDGEALTAGYTGGAFADKNAGENKAVTVNGLTMTAGNANTLTGNYLLPTTVSTSATISKRQLTALATAQNKVYDGSADATVTGVTFGNLVDGEALTAGYTNGSFATKNAGTGIDVTVNGVTMTAGNANTLTSNYVLPTTVTTTANISQRQLSATATAANKVYDGNMDATVTNVTFGNLVDGEALTAGYTGGSFASKNAGMGIGVTVNGVTMTAGNANTLAGNYLLPTTVNTTADITPRQLTAAVTAQNKVYDGTTNATVTGVTFGNLVDGEALTAGYTGGAFADKNAGKNKAVTVTGLTMTASNANTSTGNYLLPPTVTAIADVTPRSLTITAATNSKTYDGTTTAAATPSYSGLQTGDSLSGLVEAYADQNAGSGKTLQVSGYAINDGNNGNNYNVTKVDNITGSIGKAILTVTAQNATKTAGTADPSFGVTYDGFVNGETAAVLGGTLTFSTSAIVGQDNYLITPSGYSSNNYEISYESSLLTVTKPLLDSSERYQGALMVKNRYMASAPLIPGIFDGDPGRPQLTHESNPLLLIRGAGVNLDGILQVESNNPNQEIQVK